MKKLHSLVLLLISFAGYSQADTSLVRFSNPTSVSKTKGYSHAAEIELGTCKMIIISGQIALDNKGNLIGKDNLAEQTTQIFTNIKNIVAESGGTLENVVKLGIFMIDASQVQTVRNVRDKFFTQKKMPASTLVQVSKLVRDDLLLEIEATAIIPKF
ncbi:MAG: RidA family protein [Bacteroidetes bacterium]|nr:RidA family protein [Bacteroidota bacterium]